MQPHSLIVLAVFVWNAVLPEVESHRITNSCSTACAAERMAKFECVKSRNCFSLLVISLKKFSECSEPCNEIGDCYQRCALGTDEIESTCSAQCGGVSGGICYDTCYDDELNRRINQVFTKRP